MIKKAVSKSNTFVFCEKLKSYKILGILFGIFSLMLLFSVLSPHFLSINNLSNILRNSSITGPMALGMTLVILTGGIDLSVGSVLALGGSIAAGMLGKAYGLTDPVLMAPAWVSLMVAVMAAALIGLSHGLLITRLKIEPFIVTLGSMSIVRGLSYIVNDFFSASNAATGAPITFYDDFIYYIGSEELFGLPISGVIFLLLGLILAVVLRSTSFGRGLYAIGGNKEAAKAAGINVGMIIILAYTILGALSGLSGVFLTSRLMSASPLAGTGYELDVIAAVVIGGTSLKGGKGTIVGTILGVLFIDILNNGLNLLAVPSFFQYLIKGSILVAAVAFRINSIKKKS